MLSFAIENASPEHNPDAVTEKADMKNSEHLKRSSSLFQEPKLERELVKKLDRRILPLVCVLYCFSFLDRVNIGNAKYVLHESLKFTNIFFLIFDFPLLYNFTIGHNYRVAGIEDSLQVTIFHNFSILDITFSIFAYSRSISFFQFSSTPVNSVPAWHCFTSVM